MLARVALLGLLLSTFGFSPASAFVRISGDNGGIIGDYVDTYASLRQSGQRVVIDGPCLSACTMVLGFIPHDRICVTSHARLGFHAAWDPGSDGREVTNRGGTRLLMQYYPKRVKGWIARRGGLTREMIYLEGRELSSMFPPCGRNAGL